MAVRKVIPVDFPDNYRARDAVREPGANRDYVRRALQERLQAIEPEQNRLSAAFRELEQKTRDLQQLREIMARRAAALEQKMADEQADMRRQLQTLIGQLEDMEREQTRFRKTMDGLRKNQNDLEQEKAAIALALTQNLARPAPPVFPAFRTAFREVASRVHGDNKLFNINNLTGSSGGGVLAGGTC